MTDRPIQQTIDLVPVNASDVRREVRWLREAGHTFAASLLEAMWAQIGPREEGGITEPEDVRLALQATAEDGSLTDAERRLASRALAEIRRLSRG